jgi:hypothetical protein
MCASWSERARLWLMCDFACSQAYGTASAAQGYTGYQQSATSPFQYPQPQYGYPAYAAQGQYGYPQVFL